MLVLSRRIGQEIAIGDGVRVVLLDVRGKQIRLGITAPPEVRVDRQEIRARRKPSAVTKGPDREAVLCHVGTVNQNLCSGWPASLDDR